MRATIAVDERYLDQPEYRPARDGHLPNEVHIPRLRGPNDLSSLLGHRVAHVDAAHISDALTETVIEAGPTPELRDRGLGCRPCPLTPCPFTRALSRPGYRRGTKKR